MSSIQAAENFSWVRMSTLMGHDKICLFFMQENLIGSVEDRLVQSGLIRLDVRTQMKFLPACIVSQMIPQSNFE